MTTSEFTKDLKNTIGQMEQDLVTFAKWSVVNVIIIAVVWKIGSHIIWLNSIPRTFLKLLYPPGYEYVKQILAENMSSKECTDVMHNGGVTTIVAEYEPDQEETFKMRKACCPELEPPIAPGSDMDVPCWPMGTTKATLTNMQKQNYAYRVWDNDFKKCVNYVKWKSESEYEALQAKQQSIAGRMQLVKAQNKEIKGPKVGGGQLVGGDALAGKTMDELNAEVVAAQKHFDTVGANTVMGVRSPTARKAKKRLEAAKMARGNAMAEANRKTLLSRVSEEEKGGDPLRTVLEAAATESLGSSSIPAATDDARQSVANATEEPTGSAGLSASSASLAAQGLGTMGSGSSGMGMGMGMGMPELHSNVLTKSRENIIKEYMNTEDFQNAPPSKQEGMIRSFYKTIGDAQLNKLGKRTNINTKAVKNMLKIQREHDRKRNKDLIANAKKQQSVEMDQLKKVAKIQSGVVKKNRNDKLKYIQKIRKLIKSNKRADAKYKLDMELAAAGKLSEQELKAFKAKEKTMMDMQKQESKMNMGNAKAGAAALFNAIKALGKIIVSAIKFIFNSIWKIAVGITEKVLGCSFGQGVQGVFLGPNTLTSLGTNFTLAIKSSLSWLIYSCINASGGNIITAFILSTFLLVIGVSLMQIIWVSPLSTIWTLLSFKWPQLIMILSVLGFPILATIFGLMFGLMYIVYSIIYVIGFWFKCLTTSEGTAFKRQLRSCSSAQKSLRRLFFILTIINGVKHLDPKVVTGMILFLLYIEYKNR